MAVLRGTAGRIAIAVMFAVVVWAGWNVLAKFRQDQFRSRQKRTMAEMRDAGQRMMQGLPVAPFEDHWGTPVRIRVAGPHRSLRSAGADRKFETTDPRGLFSATDRGTDIVWVDETFVQLPDEIVLPDKRPGVTPDPTTRPCAACHTPKR